MKFYRILHFISVTVVIICMFSGCEAYKGIEHNRNVIKKESESILNNENMKDDNLLFNDSINIYKISHENFNSFLSNPQYDFLLENPVAEYSFCQHTSFYETYDSFQFPINNDLISFLGDTDKVIAYLQQNGISGNIRKMALLDTPTVPITLWVNMDDITCYVTINTVKNSSQYLYDFFSEEEYKNTYGVKIGIMKINGVDIKTPNPPKIHSGYADLPLLCVLENFGAKYKQYADTFFIKVNNKSYILKNDELVLNKLFNSKDNLLYSVDGGPTFIYAVENDVMVDISTLNCILCSMGIKVEIKIDENVVIINNRSS